MSLPFGMRLPLAATLSFVSGMALGISHGSQTAGLRFRAENAHRLPTTPTGWYLYHKSKNYHMALGGVKEGMKMGAKVSFWTAGFFGIEEMFDRYRGTKDFVNTVIASLSIAGGFSLWSMHHSPSPPIQTNHHRPIPRHNSSENGEDRTCYRLSLWTCARCFRSEPRAKTEICGLHTTKRKTKSRSRTRTKCHDVSSNFPYDQLPHSPDVPVLSNSSIGNNGPPAPSRAVLAIPLCFGLQLSPSAIAYRTILVTAQSTPQRFR